MKTAIAALGVTQIIGWGSTFYLLTVLGRPIARDLGLSDTVVAGGLSILLLASGFLGPTCGRMMDRHGARPVMTLGSLVAAAGLVFLSFAQGLASFIAAWLVLGTSATMALYPAAFTALTQINGRQARRAITLLTLPGGLASTVFWPLSTQLLEIYDWRTICLIYAGFNAIICGPMHWLLLPPTGERHAGKDTPAPSIEGLPAAARPRAFLLLSGMLALNSLVITGLMNQIVAMLTMMAYSAQTAVVIGMVFGVSQVSSRIFEMLFGNRYDALNTGVFCCALLPLAFLTLWLGNPAAAAGILFSVLLGASNGLVSIVRGALVQSLFGTRGYGEQMGRVTVAQGITGAMAPMLFAFVLGSYGAQTAVIACGTISLTALIAMILLFRHARQAAAPQRLQP